MPQEARFVHKLGQMTVAVRAGPNLQQPAAYLLAGLLGSEMCWSSVPAPLSGGLDGQAGRWAGGTYTNMWQ